MKKKWIITCLAIGLLVNIAQAQQSMFSLHYAAGFPTGDLSDYISEPSFRGVGISYHYLLTPSVGLGLEAGMQTFYERKEYATYQEGTASWSGIQYRYTNSFPIMASVAYFLMPEQALNPYASLGIGTIYNNRDTDLGLYRTEQDSWHFSLRPEVGVIYSFSPRFGVKLAGKYYHTFETSELGPQSFLSVNVGLVFTRSY